MMSTNKKKPVPSTEEFLYLARLRPKSPSHLHKIPESSSPIVQDDRIYQKQIGGPNLLESSSSKVPE